MRLMLIGSALSLVATTALAQDFGGQDDQDYAAEIWQYLQEQNFAGDDAVQAFPYEGIDPHGMLLETFYTNATVDGHTGALVIKNNYGPEGVTIDEVLGDRDTHFAAVTRLCREGGGNLKVA